MLLQQFIIDVTFKKNLTRFVVKLNKSDTISARGKSDGLYLQQKNGNAPAKGH